MKIMKVMYRDCGECRSWAVGELYTAYIRGEVDSIYHNVDGSVTIFVLPEGGDQSSIATWIAPHAVQRIYYGKGE